MYNCRKPVISVIAFLHDDGRARPHILRRRMAAIFVACAPKGNGTGAYGLLPPPKSGGSDGSCSSDATPRRPSPPPRPTAVRTKRPRRRWRQRGDERRPRLRGRCFRARRGRSHRRRHICRSRAARARTSTTRARSRSRDRIDRQRGPDDCHSAAVSVAVRKQLRSSYAAALHYLRSCSAAVLHYLGSCSSAPPQLRDTTTGCFFLTKPSGKRKTHNSTRQARAVFRLDWDRRV